MPNLVPALHGAGRWCSRLRRCVPAVDYFEGASNFFVRGVLLLGKGERMPFQLKPLSENAIRVPEQWIAAGAPSVGYIAPSGVPAVGVGRSP